MEVKEFRKLYADKKFDEALEIVVNAIEHDRFCPWLWVLRGNLIQLATTTELDFDDVEESYEIALEINPNYLEALEDLIHFYYAVIDDKVKARAALVRFDEKVRECEARLGKVRLWLGAEAIQLETRLP